MRASSYSRPSFREKTDVLDLRAVPAGQFDLNYRKEETHPRLNRLHVATILIAAAGLSLLAAGLLAYITHFLMLSIFPAAALFLGTMLSVFTLVGRLLRPRRAPRARPRSTLPLLFLSPLLIWAYFTTFSVCREFPIAFLLLLPPAIFASTYAADQLATHFIHWMTANPRIDRHTMERWRNRWQQRFRRGDNINPRRNDITAEEARRHQLAMHALRRYKFGRIYLFLIYILSVPACVVLVPLVPGLEPRKLVLITWLLFTLVFAKLRNRSFPDRHTAFLRAITGFLHYADTRLPLTIAGIAPDPSRPFHVILIFLLILFLFAAPFLFCLVLTTTLAWHLGRYLRNALAFSAAPTLQFHPPWVFASPVGSQRRRQAIIVVPLAMTVAAWVLQAHNFSDVDVHTFTALYRTFRPAGVLESHPIAPFIWFLADACLPLAAFLANLYFLTGPVIIASYAALEAPDAHEQHRDLSPWQGYTQRLLQSSNPEERQCRILGIEANHNIPVLQHNKLAAAHTQIQGGTMSHKTALVLTPAVEHDINRGQNTIIGVDNKGDRVLFNTAYLTAERTSRPFKWLTLLPFLSTFVWNIFAEPWFCELTLGQKIDVLMQALGLDHGEGYGRSFFGNITAELLGDSLTYQDEPTRAVIFKNQLPQGIQSWADLHLVASHLQRFVARYEKADDLVRVLGTLAGIPQLNLCPQHHPDHPALKHAVSFDEAIAEQQIIYLFLPGTTSRRTVALVNRLVIAAVYHAGLRHTHIQNTRPDIRLYIDEAQHAAGDFLRLVLEQAREYGVSITLCHQEQTQFRKAGDDMMAAIDENTGTKLRLSVENASLRREISENSGQVMNLLFSWNQSQHDITSGRFGPQYAIPDRDGVVRVNTQEALGHRLTNHDIDEASRHPNQAIVHFRQNEGPTQYSGHFVVNIPWSISEAEYFRRQREVHWPEPDERTILGKPQNGHPTAPADSPTPKEEPPSPQEKESDLGKRLLGIKRKKEGKKNNE